MKIIEKILVATDFGSSAEDALKTTLALAKAFSSEVILIHVIPKIPDSPVNLRTLKAESRKRLRELQSRFNQEGVTTGNSVVAVGSPFDEIIHASDVLDANVIVVGSGGSIDASGMCWPGLNAERLVRNAAKPVWVVKAGAPPAFERILCAVDFSDPSARALTNAIHLARTFQAKLTVLTVSQTLSGFYVPSAALTRDAQAKFNNREEKRFDTFLKRFDFTNVRWTKAMKRGVPEQEILKYTRKWSANLLLMGSSGRTGIAQILMGKVALRVFREMPCSVITVKSENVISLQLEAEIADIKHQYKHGQELLEKGFSAEALREFEGCLAKDKFYVPALHGLAEAHARLGHQKESEQFKHQAQLVQESMLKFRIESEIRSRHPFWSKP